MTLDVFGILGRKLLAGEGTLVLARAKRRLIDPKLDDCKKVLMKGTKRFLKTLDRARIFL
jgi:hypothetical protein